MKQLSSEKDRERLRRLMVVELGAPAQNHKLRLAQLNTVLAFSWRQGPRGRVDFSLPDLVTAHWAVKMVAAPKYCRLSPTDSEGRCGLQVDSAPRVLVRLGYRPGSPWIFGGEGRPGAIGVLRGALAAAGKLTSQGIRISCVDRRQAFALCAYAERLKIPARQDGLIVAIDAESVVDGLNVLQLPRTALAVAENFQCGTRQAIVAVPVKTARAEQARRKSNSEYPSPNLNTNDNKAQRTAAIEVARLLELGDLSGYTVSEPLRQAAELRRDNPNLLAYSELAAHAGMSKHVLTSRLRRFWQAIEKQSTHKTEPARRKSA